MNLYIRLALSNIRKNSRIYIPYLIACVFTVAMFFTIKALSVNSGILSMHGGSEFAVILDFGVWIVAVFAVLILFYTNSFIMKRRKTEIGLFNILGMEKKHLALVMFWETLFIFLGTLLAGLLAAFLLNKLMLLLLGLLIHAPDPISSEISLEAAGWTAILFACIFLMILIYNIIQIRTANPVELMRSKNEGEREPKTRWITALAGIVCLAAGYSIALSVENPMAAMKWFFTAVILVIIGTCCLFSAGSIALLKALRKNKNFYYRTDHFISVSSMLYRMKQNAAGLAAICILSTMVLVTLSTTTAMYMDQRDILSNVFQKNFTVQANFTDDSQAQALRNLADADAAQNGLTVSDACSYRSATIYCTESDGRITTDQNKSVTTTSICMIMVPLADYNAITGKNISLDNDQMLLTCLRNPGEQTSFDYDGIDYQVVGSADDLPIVNSAIGNYYDTYYAVISDSQVILNAYNTNYELQSTELPYIYEFNTDGSDTQQQTFTDELRTQMDEQGINGGVKSRLEGTENFYQLYGSFFFIGIYLGTMFLAATLLIIYYKQVTEGYDDRERYEIMRKVGMSTREIKKTINSQILMVFFLPIVAAVIHLAFSTRMIRGLLQLLNLQNGGLFMTCTVITVIVFALVYLIFYRLTSRAYYKIVG
ncbi:MAG: ABC transporter permease [Eubacteriaceae bacterium]|jgi:putative ABC transport system permease protein